MPVRPCLSLISGSMARQHMPEDPDAFPQDWLLKHCNHGRHSAPSPIPSSCLVSISSCPCQRLPNRRLPSEKGDGGFPSCRSFPLPGLSPATRLDIGRHNADAAMRRSRPTPAPLFPARGSGRVRRLGLRKLKNPLSRQSKQLHCFPPRVSFHTHLSISPHPSPRLPRRAADSGGRQYAHLQNPVPENLPPLDPGLGPPVWLGLCETALALALTFSHLEHASLARRQVGTANMTPWNVSSQRHP